MNSSFDPTSRLIVIRAVVEGPSGSAVIRLALDTGSTHTVIHPEVLESIGLPVDSSSKELRMTTASGTGSARQVTLQRFTALGEEKVEFFVVSHSVPEHLRLDGVLGLDFLQGHLLTIDFQHGKIRLG